MGFNRLKIATKLWVFIVIVLALLTTVAGVGLMRSASILAEGRAQQQVAYKMVQVATRWNGLTETNAARNLAMIVSSDPEISATFKGPVDATTKEISEMQKQLDALPLTEADKAQLQKIGEFRKAVISTREKARAARAEGKADEAIQIRNAQFLPALASYINAQKELVRMQEKRVEDVQELTESRRQANSIGILVGLVTIVALIAFGTIWLVGSIRDPLDQANELAARIAQGDLSTSISTTREDEFGSLLRSLATMNDSLGRMVAQVRLSTDSIATASAEIAQGNNDLAQRTEQTSSNLQATASSMDALTATVQHSTDNSRQASALAASASSVAQRGGSVVT
ncbi:MAG: MCP four helix bundle domain-containing protein, partial [Rhodoferax sp.]